MHELHARQKISAPRNKDAEFRLNLATKILPEKVIKVYLPKNDFCCWVFGIFQVQIVFADYIFCATLLIFFARILFFFRPRFTLDQKS